MNNNKESLSFNEDEVRRIREAIIILLETNAYLELAKEESELDEKIEALIEITDKIDDAIEDPVELAKHRAEIHNWVKNLVEVTEGFRFSDFQN